MLDKIIDYKKLELEHIRRKVPLKDVRSMAEDAEPPKPFLGHFGKGINIIAEVKKASPSAGVIREDFNPTDIATIYSEHGAKALSVLTDERFFQGHLDFLRQIRAHLAKTHSSPLPLLRKDFTLNEYHVFEARAAGADAVLLIVAALEKQRLKDYQALACDLGMTALVEVHDQKELDAAIGIQASVIGVNNRNLKTFKTDVQTTFDLKRHLDETLKYVLPLQGKKPAGKIRMISESGLKDHETLVDLKEAGLDGFLIGETFMREKNIAGKLKELLGQ